MKRGILFLAAACLGVFAGLTLASNYQILTVQDETMSPSFSQDSHVVVDRLLWKQSDYNREDVVLFSNTMYAETGEGSLMMKRIIGLPGEWISIEDGIVHVNNQPLNESKYVNSATLGGDMEQQYIPYGSYFVLGDNRSNSTDSRMEIVGLVEADDIQGKVIYQW